MNARLPIAAADCIFCKIVRREAPASIVDEDDRTLSFLDIRPINPGHILVIPKQHAAALADLQPSLGGHLFERAMATAAALRRSGLRCEGVNVHVADGESAGQEVFHVHLHVFPRYRGDGLGLRVGPNYGRVADRKELDAVATKVRAALTAH
ncbi:MAG TPA: HIT family protein [Thermoplasmata archaeon]|nr:HIT family protein [Thermoplasmata archaeon]